MFEILTLTLTPKYSKKSRKYPNNETLNFFYWFVIIAAFPYKNPYKNLHQHWESAALDHFSVLIFFGQVDNEESKNKYCNFFY